MLAADRAAASPDEPAAGACIAALGLEGKASAIEFIGAQPEWRLIDKVLAGYTETGRPAVNGSYVTEEDARAAQLQHEWWDFQDF